MAEKNLDHQANMQERAMDADVHDTKDGRWYGFWALIALIAGAIATGVQGHDYLAAGFLGTGALGTIGAFIKGRMTRNNG